MPSGRGRLVVVVVSGLDSYQESLLAGIGRVLEDEGYAVAVYAIEALMADLPEQLDCLIAHCAPAGLITTVAVRPEQEQELQRVAAERGVPTVHLAQDLPGQTCVRADNVQGMRALMAHLLDEHGSRMPALVRGMSHQVDHLEREQVFREELARRGIPVHEDLVIDGEGNRDEGFRAVRALLARRRDLDAVVTVDDWTAASALSAVTAAGLRVPEDVAVTGFDNAPIAVLTWPGITTVDQDLVEQGRAAAAALLRQIGGAPGGEHLRMPCRVVRRGSTWIPGDEEREALTAAAADELSRLTRTHLSDQNAQIRLSRELLRCRTLDDVTTTLAAELGPLGVRRCFLVLRPDTGGVAGASSGAHRVGQLLLDFRDGATHPLGAARFRDCLLPGYLHDELTHGMLCVVRLSAGGTDLGNLILEYQPGATPVAETLRLDIGKAIKTCLDTDELQGTVLRLHGEMAERRRMEAQLRLSSTVFDQAPDGIAIVDARARVLSLNPSLVAATGYRLQDLVGRPVSLLRPGRQGTDTYRALRQALEQDGCWEGEMTVRRRDGQEFLARVSVSVVGGSGAQVDQYVIICNDVSELRRKDDYIAHLAFHDELTGLPNRALLTDRLNHRIALAEREGDRLGVMFVDLDRFRAVNGSYGHEVGNAVLCESATRLKDSLRESDTVARVGGDEFVAVLTQTVALEGQAHVARRVISDLSQPASIHGQVLRVGASVGIANYPEDGRDAAELIRHAEAAMHSAKAGGGGNCAFFRPEMTALVQSRLQLEMDLRTAVDSGGLVLHYQPKVAIADRSLCGVEALVRWQHPERGLLGPLEFVPLAEECGLICDLGAWVLDEACRQSARWRESFGRVVRIGVNVSAHQVQQTDLVAEVSRACRAHRVPLEDLEVELTESQIMDNLPHVVPAFSGLRDVGVRVAVDDFGTGYSSFAYLRDLPVDVLKIDRSFLTHAQERRRDREILKTIVGLGRALNLDVVAEGVETQGQADLLLSYQCRTAQGYLFARPLPAEDFAKVYLSGVVPERGQGSPERSPDAAVLGHQGSGEHGSDAGAHGSGPAEHGSGPAGHSAGSAPVPGPRSPQRESDEVEHGGAGRGR